MQDTDKGMVEKVARALEADFNKNPYAWWPWYPSQGKDDGRAFRRMAAIALTTLSDPQSPDEVMQTEDEACIACDLSMKAGERFYSDESGGVIHADCCGSDRESYTLHGRPLGPSDPIPTPQVWEG